MVCNDKTSKNTLIATIVRTKYTSFFYFILGTCKHTVGERGGGGGEREREREKERERWR